VSRTRLCDLLTASAKLLEPIYEAMIARVKMSFAIHADETTVRLLRPRRGAYAWLYRGDQANPFTVFDFTPGRGAEYPREFLKGYAGWMHADGYEGYNPLHGGGERHIGCWAHVRRKFVEARTNDPAKSSEALAFIRTLYAVEKEIVEQQLVSDNVVSLRQTRAGPVLRKFGDWLEAESKTLLPKSSFGEAVTYARNQWPTLGRYLNDAGFTIDNNIAEREVRPLAVGRKNWLHIGGDGGLLSASVLMSVCVSAKRHGLNPWLYLRDVLVRMATHPTDVTDLLPDAWAKRQLPATA
jgi:transposase